MMNGINSSPLFNPMSTLGKTGGVTTPGIQQTAATPSASASQSLFDASPVMGGMGGLSQILDMLMTFLNQMMGGGLFGQGGSLPDSDSQQEATSLFGSDIAGEEPESPANFPYGTGSPTLEPYESPSPSMTYTPYSAPAEETPSPSPTPPYEAPAPAPQPSPAPAPAPAPQPSPAPAPSYPKKPETPKQPDKPEKPCPPEKPSKPEKPYTPEKPDKPEKPYTPEKPKTPEKPTEPYKDNHESKYYGDPHFEGFGGEKYDVMGESGKNYNILSDKGLQYNGKFVAWDKVPGSTVIGEAGITSGKDQIEYKLNDTPELNGKKMETGKDYDLDASGKAKWDGSKLHYENKDYTIDLSKDPDTPEAILSNVKVKKGANPLADGVDPHGLLGQTADGVQGERKGKDNTGDAKQGGTVIDGTYKDYEVKDLLDTGFKKHNRFKG